MMTLASISDGYFTSTILVGSLLLPAIVIFSSSRKDKSSSNSNCAEAPTSSFENNAQLSSGKCPFFLLDTMRALKSDIYKLKLPILSGSVWYIIGNAEASREILLDETTVKPSFGGTPNLFSRASKDPKWYHVRKTAAPAFSSSEVKRMNAVCKSSLEAWIEERLEPFIDSGDTFDPSKEMTYLTYKVILEAAFEYENASHQEYEIYHRDLEKTVKEFVFQSPFRPLFGLFKPARRRAFKAAKDKRTFIAKILEQYRNNPNKSDNNTIIRLIESSDTLSEQEKISELDSFLTAGHDTTGYSLANILVLMAKHPEEAEKLKKDLVSAEMMNEGKPLGTGSKYLKNVIQEGARLMPTSATGSIRVTKKDFVFRDGSLVVPKNSIIMSPFLLSHRSDEYFEEPDEFRPGRWVDASKEMKNAVMPFSLGKRNCIGQRLATTELNSCLPILLSKYKFELVEEGEPEFFLTLRYTGAKLRAMRI